LDMMRTTSAWDSQIRPTVARVRVRLERRRGMEKTRVDGALCYSVPIENPIHLWTQTPHAARINSLVMEHVVCGLSGVTFGDFKGCYFGGWEVDMPEFVVFDDARWRMDWPTEGGRQSESRHRLPLQKAAVR